MPKKRVFISYRREDSASAAGRVYDRLCGLLSRDSVFIDVSTIGGGEQFENKIRAEIDRSDVALVFIGRLWLGSRSGAEQPRIWEPGDLVRAEVRYALDRDMLVVPILLDGAPMPATHLLPEDIQAISKRNALPLRHDRFDDDVANILAAILGISAERRPWEKKRRLAVKIGCAAAGAVAGLVALVVVAMVHQQVFERPLAASIGGDASSVLLLIAAAFIGCALGLYYETRSSLRKST